MNSLAYRKLVARLELDHSHAPRRFLFHTLLLAALGYLVPLLMIGLPILGMLYGYALTQDDQALPGGLIILALMVFLFSLLRYLHSPIAPPAGYPIAATQAPRLFRLIDKMQARISGPTLRGVIIDTECRLAVATIPHQGVFGGNHYYLVIGLPLLQALSPNQFAAIMGREYSLIATEAHKFNAGFYRLWQHWLQLQDALAQPTNPLMALPARFFGWYIPLLSAHCLIRLRQHALDADQAAAQFAGADRTAHGLLRGILVAHYLQDHFWPTIFSAADQQPQPLVFPHASMEQALRDIPVDDRAMRRWLKKSLEHRQAVNEFQPALKARLAALHEQARVIAHAETSAAHVLLEATLTPLIATLDQQWHDSVIKDWRLQHDSFQAARKTVSEMQDVSADTLATPVIKHLAEAHLKLGERERALALLSIATQRPKVQVDTLWLAAQELLRDDNAAALPLLDLVIQRDQQLQLEAAAQAMELCDLLGMRDRASNYRSLVQELERRA